MCVCGQCTSLTFSYALATTLYHNLLYAHLSIYTTPVTFLRPSSSSSSSSSTASGLSHADPHLIVTVHVDKRTVITRENHAIILVLHGSHPIGQKGLLELVLVLLEVPVGDEGRKERKREGDGERQALNNYASYSERLTYTLKGGRERGREGGREGRRARTR